MMVKKFIFLLTFVFGNLADYINWIKQGFKLEHEKQNNTGTDNIW